MSTVPVKVVSPTKNLLVSVAVMLLLGVAAGFVWIWLAHPAEWEVRTGGSIVLTEAAARGQFSVIVVFIVTGAIASLGWAWVTSHVLRDLGWILTPLVIVLTLVAALIAWRIGVVFGPPGPLHAVRPAVGDKLPSKLAVDGVAPFLVWPIVGLAGVLAATWSGHEAPVDDEPVDDSPVDKSVPTAS